MNELTLTPQSVEKFKQILVKDYEVILSDEEASLQANDLVQLLLYLYKRYKNNKQSRK